MREEVIKMIEEYYIANRREMCKRAYNLVGKDFHLAEDAIQMTFERAIKYSKSFNTERNMKPWFNMIMGNSCKDIMKEERHGGMKVELTEKHEEVVHYDPENNDMMKLIIREAELKNEQTADVLKLYFTGGYSAVEINQIVEANYSNIKKIISRFRAELILKYGEEFFYC